MAAVAAQHYTTPERVWALELPEETLCGTDSNIKPGTFTTAVKLAGTGTGLIRVDGNPHGTIADLRIKCVVAGTLNQKNLVNPGALPQFQISTDGGTTWQASQIVSSDNDTAYIRSVSIGVRWVFYGATPAFVATDVWQTSTAPSPTILSLIGTCSSHANRFLIGSCGRKMPLTTWPEALEQVVAELVRWELVKKRGLAADQKMAQYRPVSALEWLEDARKGLFTDDADFSGAGSGFVYPDVVSSAEELADFGDGRWWVA